MQINTVNNKNSLISKSIKIGDNVKIESYTKIRDNVEIGNNCDIRNYVFIDEGVKIGDNVKIMDQCLIYRGLIIEDNVFIGPKVTLLNDKNPRQNKIRDLSGKKWCIRKNASIGGGSIILPDINIGEFALIGAGSVVTKDVPRYGLVYGNPAKLKGVVCENAHVLEKPKTLKENNTEISCKICKNIITLNNKILNE